MASGTFTLSAQSVDNGTVSGGYSTCGSLPSGTCYTSANAGYFGRGAVTNNITLSYSVNDSGLLSISYDSYSGPNWYVCSYYGYNLDIDFSTDGNNWTNIMHSFANDWQTCTTAASNRVSSIASSLAAGLVPVVLTQSGYIRARMWTSSACPTCGGTSGTDVWPNAFPNDAASVATAVPVHIDVNWNARLNYDANGGSGAPSAQTASVPTATTSHDFTVSSTTPTWGDYIFLGWSTVQHSGSCTPEDVEYEAGDTFTVQKSNPTRTLYAVWMKDYRPGEVLTSNVWKSTNRTGGKCQLLSNNSWVEMRTIDGGSGTGNPPSRRTSGAWKNQYKIGSA